MSQSAKQHIKGMFTHCGMPRGGGRAPRASTNGRTTLPVTSLILQQSRAAVGAPPGGVALAARHATMCKHTLRAVHPFVLFDLMLTIRFRVSFPILNITNVKIYVINTVKY